MDLRGKDVEESDFLYCARSYDDYSYEYLDDLTFIPCGAVSPRILSTIQHLPHLARE